MQKKSVLVYLIIAAMTSAVVAMPVGITEIVIFLGVRTVMGGVAATRHLPIDRRSFQPL